MINIEGLEDQVAPILAEITGLAAITAFQSGGIDEVVTPPPVPYVTFHIPMLEEMGSDVLPIDPLTSTQDTVIDYELTLRVFVVGSGAGVLSYLTAIKSALGTPEGRYPFDLAKLHYLRTSQPKSIQTQVDSIWMTQGILDIEFSIADRESVVVEVAVQIEASTESTGDPSGLPASTITITN